MIRRETVKSSCIQSVMLIFFIGWLLLLPSVDQALAQSPAKEVRPINRLYFIENRGQIDRQVSYYLQTEDKVLYFTPTGVTLALGGAEPSRTANNWVVKLDFVGGGARPVGQLRMNNSSISSWSNQERTRPKSGWLTGALRRFD